MTMSDKELNAIVKNEIEWRKQLWKKLESTEESLNAFKLDMTETTSTMKVKLGFIGSFFGFIGGAVVAIIAAIIK